MWLFYNVLRIRNVYFTSTNHLLIFYLTSTFLLQDRLIQLWVRLIQIRVRLIQVQVRLIQDMEADSRGEERGGKFGRGLVEVK